MSRRRRVKCRIPNPEKTSLLQPISSNFIWSIDLNINLFDNFDRVRELTEEFMDDYNNNHSYKSLGDKSPVCFSRDRNKNVTLNFV